MQLSRVAVLGAGPGGLYMARLLKLAQPACEVVVHEQGSPEVTFGFGVGLAARTQRKLDEADPASLRDILANSYAHDMRMRIGGREAGMEVGSLVAIGRAELLAVLRRHAEEAGVKLEFGVRRTASELDADLVVAADGAGSATRQEMAKDVESHVDTGGGLYLWAGADFALEHALFAMAETGHGPFVIHAYPYAPNRSTVLVETDEDTWRAAGFDRSSEQIPADRSDDVSLRFLQTALAEHLEGHNLIGNRTRWQRFRTVRCHRWHSGNIALLGDAAHTAHYSVGSGTKLAMEDAIALTSALDEETDLASALERYEGARQPAVERLQSIAERSRRWWESFPERSHLPVEQLLIAYMTRAGNVSLERFAGSNPELVHAALTQYSAYPVDGDLADWVLDQPLDWHGHRFSRRIVDDNPAAWQAAVVDMGAHTSPSDDSALVAGAVDEAYKYVGAGSEVVWLTGSDDRASLLTRFEVAERLRRHTSALIVVAAHHSARGDLADALASARAHLIACREQE